MNKLTIDEILDSNCNILLSGEKRERVLKAMRQYAEQETAKPTEPPATPEAVLAGIPHFVSENPEVKEVYYTRKQAIEAMRLYAAKVPPDAERNKEAAVFALGKLQAAEEEIKQLKVGIQALKDIHREIQQTQNRTIGSIEDIRNNSERINSLVKSIETQEKAFMDLAEQAKKLNQDVSDLAPTNLSYNYGNLLTPDENLTRLLKWSERLTLQKIQNVLINNGFSYYKGDMIRPDTFCRFSYGDLIKYKSVAEFTERWGYK